MYIPWWVKLEKIWILDQDQDLTLRRTMPLVYLSLSPHPIGFEFFRYFADIAEETHKNDSQFKIYIQIIFVEKIKDLLHKYTKLDYYII